MFSADTVYVIATSRGAYPATDLVRSLHWTSARDHYIVIVDRKKDVELPSDLDKGHTILTVEGDGNVQDQFVAGTGIKWCLDQGIEARQFVVLDDKCLVMQQGLDVWALEHMTKTQVGLMGVTDRMNYSDAYSKVTALFDRWDMPHSMWVPQSETVHESVLFLSGELANALFTKNMLNPDGADQWPMPYGPFISWSAQMLGFYQVGWGHMDRPIPPLYANHTRHHRNQPAPHILNTGFKLYYSVQHVPAYSEERLRETFKRLRGEDAKEYEPIRPTVSPQPTGPPTTQE